MPYIKKLFVLLFAVLLLLPLYGKEQTALSTLDTTTIKTANGEVIPVILTNKGLIFKGYEEKIVLLEAFGYRCPPCQASIPGYNRLQQKYQKEIVIIAVEAWKADSATFQQFVKQHHMGYKAVSTADSGKILSFMGRLTGWHPGVGVPYLMLFAKGGIFTKDVPPQRLPESHVDTLIKQLLKKT